MLVQLSIVNGMTKVCRGDAQHQCTCWKPGHGAKYHSRLQRCSSSIPSTMARSRSQAAFDCTAVAVPTAKTMPPSGGATNSNAAPAQAATPPPTLHLAQSVLRVLQPTASVAASPPPPRPWLPRPRSVKRVLLVMTSIMVPRVLFAAGGGVNPMCERTAFQSAPLVRPQP